MEEFFQYIGPESGAAAPSLRDRAFVYSSPRETTVDRCGELRAGAYFACSGISYYEDQCWMKIRRGYFSNAKNNGYIRVEFEFSAGNGGDLPARQQSSATAREPTQFRHLRRLPAFPAFLCSRERLVLSRSPVYNLHTASVSSSEPTRHHMQRYLPPVSVFHATESRFNDDFTQLAIKVTSSFGMTGWINASFSKTLVEVEDPRAQLHNPIYVQNVAAKAGKWAGELPVRVIPSLQAPRQYTVESFRIVRALERKLVKDQIWVRIEPFRHEAEEKKSADGADSKSDAESDSSVTSRSSESKGNPGGDYSEQKANTYEQAWIIERNAGTAQRVVVPWGSPRIVDAPISDELERYYRNVYSRRPLPLRTDPTPQSLVVGHLQPGTVFISTKRVLNDKGQMWIRVALSDAKRVGKSKDTADDGESGEDTIEYGYAIQSNAKTNSCMVQEIPAPGKMEPKRFYQVVCSPGAATATNVSANDEDDEGVVAARTEASSTEGTDVFSMKNGAIVSAIGTVFNSKEQRMWLQVLAADIDSVMRVRKDAWTVSSEDQSPSVLYLPMCDPSPSSSSPAETIMKPINCALTKMDNPRRIGHGFKSAATRVVFSGRASKLFSSQLMRPSTIDLPTFSKKSPNNAMDTDSPVAAAAGEVQEAQNLREEIARWQQETTARAGTVYSNVNSALLYAVSCVIQPFASCLASKPARERYSQLDQDDDTDDDESLPRHEVNV